jgi:hypothetical protein
MLPRQIRPLTPYDDEHAIVLKRIGPPSQLDFLVLRLITKLPPKLPPNYLGLGCNRQHKKMAPAITAIGPQLVQCCRQLFAGW